VPSALSLFVYLLAGVGGMAYFVYGKRQQNGVFLAAGVLLCIYPYFFDSVLALIVIGLILLSAPFLLSR
jgi:glucokinase